MSVSVPCIDDARAWVRLAHWKLELLGGLALVLALLASAARLAADTYNPFIYFRF